MKHLRSRLVLLMLLASATAVFAGPQLYDLNIRVELAANGDARITETRQMQIDSEGTECYIVIGNLNGSEIRDFEVSDELGQAFTNIGGWDINRSRSEKALSASATATNSAGGLERAAAASIPPVIR